MASPAPRRALNLTPTLHGQTTGRAIGGRPETTSTIARWSLVATSSTLRCTSLLSSSSRPAQVRFSEIFLEAHLESHDSLTQNRCIAR
ncbi:unnamed protein product [Victoria cruziana]